MTIATPMMTPIIGSPNQNQAVVPASSANIEPLARPTSSSLPMKRSALDRLRSRVASARTATVSVCRSEEHTSELQSLMRISYAVFCLKKKNTTPHTTNTTLERSKKHYTIHNHQSYKY